MQINCIIMYALYIANVEPVHYLPGCFGAGKVKKKEENLKSIILFEVKNKQCIIHYSTIQREGILVSLPKEIGFKNDSCGRDL